MFGVVLTVVFIITVLAGLALAQRGRGRPSESGAEFGWINDLAKARELAQKSGKPIMVVIRCVP